MFQWALSAALLSPGIAVYMKLGPKALFCCTAAEEAGEVDGTAILAVEPSMVSPIPGVLAKMLLMFCCGVLHNYYCAAAASELRFRSPFLQPDGLIILGRS